MRRGQDGRPSARGGAVRFPRGFRPRDVPAWLSACSRAPVLCVRAAEARPTATGGGSDFLALKAANAKAMLCSARRTRRTRIRGPEKGAALAWPRTRRRPELSWGGGARRHTDRSGVGNGVFQMRARDWPTATLADLSRGHRGGRRPA
jgi:hypothetical protein